MLARCLPAPARLSERRRRQGYAQPDDVRDPGQEYPAGACDPVRTSRTRLPVSPAQEGTARQAGHRPCKVRGSGFRKRVFLARA